MQRPEDYGMLRNGGNSAADVNGDYDHISASIADHAITLVSTAPVYLTRPDLCLVPPADVSTSEWEDGENGCKTRRNRFRVDFLGKTGTSTVTEDQVGQHSIHLREIGGEIGAHRYARYLQRRQQ